MDNNDPRKTALTAWLTTLKPFGLDISTLAPASNDASFRRYFRITSQSHGSLIAMDAPPPMEDVQAFVKVAELFATAKVSVPSIVAKEVQQGFLLLSDFGNTTYLSVLDEKTAPALYKEASDALVKMQSISSAGLLPDYDQALLSRELALYPDWYVTKHKGFVLSEKQRKVLDQAFELILQNNLAQPKVFVHRDYHSRNLMLLPGSANPGILDFQDAVYGPITYDMVSLLRDAYIRWDEQVVIDSLVRYWEAARRAKLPVAGDFSEFYRDFEWMGLQRHIKVLGIFARLCYRDGKDRYLADMPMVFDYVIKAAGRYSVLAPLVDLMQTIEGGASNAKVGYTF